MASWLYIFSKFTDEALLFEALFTCTVFTAYAAYWILRKRKFGVLGQQSQSVVQNVLSELIFDAEQLRAQLFGLLSGSEMSAVSVTAQRAMGVAGSTNVVPLTSAPTHAVTDTQISAALTALEAKLAEQTKAMDTIVTDKSRLETELAAAKASGGGNGGGGNSGDAEKIKLLEAKLAEYSVIEDDLANLKRLQQENAALKAQLAGKGGAPSALAAAAQDAVEAAKPPAPEAPPVAAAPAAIEEVAQPLSVAEPDSANAAQEAADAAMMAAFSETPAENSAQAAVDAALAAAATEAAAISPEGAIDPAAATADPAFEGLVDKVEQSLQDTPPQAAAGATASPITAAPATPAAASPASVPKSDADLVAEFEKMLNS